MFKFFSLSNTFIWIEKLTKFISSIFFILLLVALSFALILSPPDYLQGDSVRIMYVHVPAAWIGLASFSTIALLSLANFVFKIKNIKLITKSIAPIGLMFTCLAIVTGAIWGQPTWGTWWAWDARITSMLILALFYGMYLLAWRIYEDKDQVFKILDPNKTEIRFNSEWCSSMKFDEVIKLSSHITVAQMLARDDFAKRYSKRIYCPKRMDISA